MRVRFKIILVVLPILILTLVLAEAASWFSATNGITRMAREFLSFKIYELENYAHNQWTLLADNGYDGRPEMVAAAKGAVEAYARSVALSPTEAVFALSSEGKVEMATRDIGLTEEQARAVLADIRADTGALRNIDFDGRELVIMAFYFAPFDWYVCLTEEHRAFYRDVDRITVQTIIILAVSSLAAVILLFFFARALTRPLDTTVNAMQKIIGSADLSSRVEVEYNDETGRLAQTFNIMIGELEKSWQRAKRFAFQSVLAQKTEQRIRQIFQKYVPKDLIDKFFASPESMLTGENRELAILFSDIRSFTTISEGMAPDELVNSLNRYFSNQVDIIMNRGGIVDKYIGDAIMAFWGAPVKHEHDAQNAILSALDMLDAVRDFNSAQQKLGKPEFHIGIGINYGLVTVGNIGSERKMDYTVIGDSVNLASRLEGLTKMYHAEILVSESFYAAVSGVHARLLDTVAVKGKTRGVKIYTIKRDLTASEQEAWGLHNKAMELFYARSFEQAAAAFSNVSSLLVNDNAAAMMLERCTAYQKNPPPDTWNGVEVMHSK
ncbi:MAG: HAMP domain-containing protein [Spirochaetaceae bacterium]|jgi:class 3 adenylate cyclase/HAMP domain-containing protein|nr:HAMP domain-containing protein [Spirochaetaceae bacterium]